MDTTVLTLFVPAKSAVRHIFRRKILKSSKQHVAFRNLKFPACNADFYKLFERPKQRPGIGHEKNVTGDTARQDRLRWSANISLVKSELLSFVFQMTHVLGRPQGELAQPKEPDNPIYLRLSIISSNTCLGGRTADSGSVANGSSTRFNKSTKLGACVFT